MLSRLLSSGGPVIYILLACSIFALAIILERLFYWLVEKRKNSAKKLKILLDSPELSAKDLESLSGEIKEILSQKKIDPERSADLLIRHSERTYERSIRYLNGLDTVVSIAPLLGILGTVLGIMKSFHALDFQHMTSPGQVGHGLAEAMLTTATGLAIAVPVLVFYNLFNSLAVHHAAAIYKLAEAVRDQCRSTRPKAND